jgi:hypothetical protein
MVQKVACYCKDSVYVCMCVLIVYVCMFVGYVLYIQYIYICMDVCTYLQAL